MDESTLYETQFCAHLPMKNRKKATQMREETPENSFDTG